MDPSAYLEDASGFRGHAERVFVPADEAELLDVLREATRTRTPVTVSGAGTGVTGGRVAQGGWVVSLEKFTRLEIHPGYAVCGAGVLLADVHAAALRSNQLYAPDPTETAASMGGTIACNASGSRSFLYGDTRRHLRRLRVALADGTVIDKRRGEAIDFAVPEVAKPDTTKHSAGYHLTPGMDWIDLFTGSEGTLGVVMEAEVQLVELPAELLSGVIFFPGDDAALEAVDDWRGVPALRMLEYMDAGALDLLRPRYDEIPGDAHAALLIEQTIDREEQLDEWFDRLSHARAFEEASWFGTTAQDRERFRRFRHALPETVNDTVRKRGFMKLGSDYAAPVARNSDMLALYRRRLEAEFPGQYVIFGHIGDAHVHVNILPATPEEFDRARELMYEFAGAVVEMGGTVSAEHGLGKRKAGLLQLQYSAEEIAAMRAVKLRLDPHWLLGRGTLFEWLGE